MDFNFKHDPNWDDDWDDDEEDWDDDEEDEEDWEDLPCIDLSCAHIQWNPLWDANEPLLLVYGDKVDLPIAISEVTSSADPYVMLTYLGTPAVFGNPKYSLN